MNHSCNIDVCVNVIHTLRMKSARCFLHQRPGHLVPFHTEGHVSNVGVIVKYYHLVWKAWLMKLWNCVFQSFFSQQSSIFRLNVSAVMSSVLILMSNSSQMITLVLSDIPSHHIYVSIQHHTQLHVHTSSAFRFTSFTARVCLFICSGYKHNLQLHVYSCVLRDC